MNQTRKHIPKNFGFFHFVGIGGIGMSGIAEILIKSGYEVQGSDVSSSKIIDRLISLGVKTFIGHDKNNIKNAKDAKKNRPNIAKITMLNPETKIIVIHAETNNKVCPRSG